MMSTIKRRSVPTSFTRRPNTRSATITTRTSMAGFPRMRSCTSTRVTRSCPTSSCSCRSATCSIAATRRLRCLARTRSPGPAAASDPPAASTRSPSNFERRPRRARSGSDCATRCPVRASTKPTSRARYTGRMSAVVAKPFGTLRASRRAFLQRGSALGLVAIAGSVVGAPPIQTDFCSRGRGRSVRLFLPGDRGYLGRLAPHGQLITLVAAPAGELPAGIVHGSLAYHVRHAGRDYVNPTLVVRRGERIQVRLVNRLDQPTITHWHGLSVDTHNDGAGTTLIGPGETYAYDFEVRERSSLYWYHPHPHGQTALQL